MFVACRDSATNIVEMTPDFATDWEVFRQRKAKDCRAWLRARRAAAQQPSAT